MLDIKMNKLKFSAFLNPSDIKANRKEKTVCSILEGVAQIKKSLEIVEVETLT